MRLPLFLAMTLTSGALADLGVLGQPEVPDATQETVLEPPRPFRIGHDNLAFVNPGGAVTVGRFSGNCYTMAWTARLFHRRASFRPDAAGGLDLVRIAEALGGTGAGRFEVPGAPDLFALSRPDAPDLEARVFAELRRRAGQDPGPTRDAAPPRTDLLELFRLLSTVHYTHYVQERLDTLAGAVAGNLMGMGWTPHAVTAQTLATVRAELRRGSLPIVTIFNPTPDVTYGHAVLAYRVVDVRDGAGDLLHTDVYVYDSNIQHGEQRAESVLRVRAADGRHALLLREADGSIAPDPRYDDDAWFTGSRSCLLHFPDPADSPRSARALAAKLRHAEEETAYLLAGDRFLDRLTGTSPEDSPLIEDVKRLVLDLQGSARAHGVDLAGLELLEEDATGRDVNDFLRQVAPGPVAAAAPYLLPAGLGLETLRVRFSRRNRAVVRLGFRVEGEGAAADILAALRRSSLLAGAEALARALAGAAALLAGEVLRVDLLLAVEKGPSPDPRLGTYGPVVALLGSRVIAGAMTPEDDLVRPGEHRLHLAEGFLESALREGLRAGEVLGTEHAVDYETLVFGEKTADLTLDRVDLDCTAAGLEVALAFHGFAGLTRVPWEDHDRGVAYRTLGDAPLRFAFELGADRRGHLEVAAAVTGSVDADDGLGGVASGIVTSIAEAAFPLVEDFVEEALTDGLGGAVALAPRASVDLRDLETDSTGTRVDLTAAVAPLALDVEGTVRRVVGATLPVRLFGAWTTAEGLVLRFVED